MRFVPFVVVLACTSALLVGCGKDEAEPAPTAQELFCDSFRPYVEASQADLEASEADVVARMKAFADAVAGLEKPEEMSAEAAAGLDMWSERILALPADASQKAVMKALNKGVTPTEQGQMEAFIAYGNSACLKAA